MPLYKHTLTGKLTEADEAFVSAFPEGTYEFVSEESAHEERERLIQEALDAKVDPEETDTVETPTPEATKRKAKSNG